jgi:hypothetical protein
MDHKLERETLLIILRGNVEKAKTFRFEELAIADWHNVVQQAVRQGVAPLLYQRLKIFNTGILVPTAIMEKLREAYLHSVERNVRLFHELSQVLRVFQNNDIPVIVLKGIHLAKFVYDNIALRPMSDVDLLVRKIDLSRVEEKLIELNYHSQKPIRNEEECKSFQHLAPYVKQNAFPIEIHWTITRPSRNFTIDAASDLWERSRSVTIDDVKSLVLSPEDLLLHLCFHTSYHGFRFGLRSICDISEIIRQYRNEINWEQVQLRASNWKMVKYIYISLYLAKELLEAAVPDEVLEKLMPDDLDLQMVALAQDIIFNHRDAIAAASPFSIILAELLGDKTLKEKISILKTGFIPSQEFIAQKHSIPPYSLRIYFYYSMRLKDALLKHSRSAWQLLFRKKELIYLTKCVNQQTKIKNWLISP